MHKIWLVARAAYWNGVRRTIMHKIWLVARAAYWSSVRHPAFWAFTAGLPLALLGALALMGLMTAQFVVSDRRPIAYVDESGALTPAADWLAEARDPLWVDMWRAGSEAEALRWYEAGQVQAYYVVRADFLESGRVKQVSNGLGAFRVLAQFRTYLREGLLRATPDDYGKRAAAGTTLLHRSLVTGYEQTYQNWLQWGVAAFVVAAFWLINASSNSDALYALHDEERQNTLEISLTAVNTQQLIAGKVLGVVGAGLTQFLAWAALAAIGLALVLTSLARSGIALSLGPVWGLLALSFGLCLPSYVMNVAGLVLFSALAELAGRGERVVWGIINFAALFAGPLTFVAVNAPDHPAAVILSLLPFSAPMAMVARYAQIAVPAWQVVLSLALVWGAALLNVAFVARAYRLTWLWMGQKNWARAIFSPGQSQGRV